ncbi:hypothetical protein BBJ28_00005879 [Nothophytophthora sp. Chile5]|nr:hypothetical protein BBJ28_00005879 [Nothophytophthora sp. Chile5]
MSPPASETHYELVRDAIFDNDRARVAELLAAPGVDVDHFDAGGQTLLHLACFWGRMELAKLLLAAGASLKTKNAAGCTALDLATHWGHSAVAEVIRLRGGSSVWEDKMGALQVQLEDLTLQNQQLEAQNDDKARRLDAQAQEIQALHMRLEEEKSAHLLTMTALQRTRQRHSEQATAIQQLEQERSDLSRQLKATLVAQNSAENASQRAEQEMAALRAHRDDILAQMQASVKQQEAVTHNWQRAEVAAAIADSQRNFAFAERDQVHRAHVAVLGELLVTTERLGAAEQELMTLKTDLAEHIYEKNREQRLQKHAARAVESVRVDSIALGGRRPHTTPVVAPLGGEKPRKSKPEEETREPTKAKPKTHFSLAAREFGQRMRVEEEKKLRERERRQQRIENQFVTHGLHAAAVDAELFQEEFVSTVRAFASARHDKWQQLKRDRDRQARFAANALARPITTAPLPTQRQGTQPSGLHGTLNFSLYGKYAAAAGRTAMRPTTSCTELRLNTRFLSTAAEQRKLQTETIGGEEDKRPAVTLPLV